MTENRTLKRALTDPRILSGIGNAYSDEILHAARLSPVCTHAQTHARAVATAIRRDPSDMRLWIARLQGETKRGFPKHVTAFREEMAVHGRYGKPCPVCGEKVQRIRYADNETNYCARCQTGGKLWRTRSLSRLLKSDWPRTPRRSSNRFVAVLVKWISMPRARSQSSSPPSSCW